MTLEEELEEALGLSSAMVAMEIMIRRFREGWGTSECTCDEAYASRGLHAPERDGCAAVVHEYLFEDG